MKRFLTLLPALALAVVLTGLLACSGGDDDGGQLLYTPVPVTAEINGLVRLDLTNVNGTSGSYYPIGEEIAAYALDSPEGDPLDETTIRSDSSYSLSVTGYAGTPVYLYLNRSGVLTRLGTVVIQAGNVRYDIREAVKTVTIKGNTAEYVDASNPYGYTVKIVDGDAYSPVRVLGAASVGSGTPYTIEIPVPAATATYSVFMDVGSGSYISIPLPIKVGTVEVRSNVSGDITYNISHKRAITAISGKITYKVNSGNTPYSGIIFAGSAETLSQDTYLGVGGSSGLGTPTPYTISITRPTAAATVYLFTLPTMTMMGMGGSVDVDEMLGNAVRLAEVSVPAGAATAAKDFTYTVSGYTTSVSGSLSYKENGIEQAIGSMLFIFDADDNIVGSGSITGSVGSYRYTGSVNRESSSVTVYFGFYVGIEQVKSDPVEISGTADKTANIAITRTVSTIKGEIGGSGKSAISTLLYVYNKDRDAEGAEIIGTATITSTGSGGPYTYTGKITRPTAALKAYYYVVESMPGGSMSPVYYKIGEKDLAADKSEYINDFIIGLVNKRIVPAL
jgi:hypothetical protein